MGFCRHISLSLKRQYFVILLLKIDGSNGMRSQLSHSNILTIKPVRIKLMAKLVEGGIYNEYQTSFWWAGHIYRHYSLVVKRCPAHSFFMYRCGSAVKNNRQADYGDPGDEPMPNIQTGNTAQDLPPQPSSAYH